MRGRGGEAVAVDLTQYLETADHTASEFIHSDRID